MRLKAYQQGRKHAAKSETEAVEEGKKKIAKLKKENEGICYNDGKLWEVRIWQN